MSIYTKIFIAIAIGAQFILFAIVFLSYRDNVFYMSSGDIFNMIMASLCTLIYIPAIVVSYDSDQVIKKLKS